ncbi:MAG: hypothetical protein CSA49_03385 [Gammaproteobacteria bacterium]|nr:MAG: hypothetical protein CSA49_03385 [Gammaproteobacteria bacterium]
MSFRITLIRASVAGIIGATGITVITDMIIIMGIIGISDTQATGFIAFMKAVVRAIAGMVAGTTNE